MAMTSYQEIRAAGMAFHNKALDATQHLDFHPLRIAKRMTLPSSGRTLIFNEETEQYAFFDFELHEYRINGKSLVERVDPIAAKLDPLEVELLQAHRNSRTSLFLTEEVSPNEPVIRLRDLLEPDRPDVLLTDIGLSGSMRRLGVRLAIFLRVVTVRDVNMTSGFSFGFEMEYVPGFLQAYRQKTKRIPPAQLPEARFIFFFQKHRRSGVDQEYADVR